MQLTTDAGVLAGTAWPDRTNPRLVYYHRGAEVLAQDITTFETRKIGEVPGPFTGGFQQPTQSGDGRFLTITKQRDSGNWEIGQMEIASGQYKTVITQGFRIGHVQHDPKRDRIFYVWETGGYAPQRTWIVNADGSANRPFYYRSDPKEWFTPLKEWVTHESWVPETGDMTLILDKAGILIADPEGQAWLLPGDYWHCAASMDGERIVADDNAGRLWLLDVLTGNRRLLAGGLRDGVRSVHAHACFDRRGEWVFFNTGRTHAAVALIRLPHGSGLP